jgi:ATP-dependent Lhr-like helicase
LPADAPSAESASGNARLVHESLQAHGALFFEDLLAATGLLPAQLEDALSELAARGLVTSDGFAALRVLVSPDLRRKLNNGRRGLARRTRKMYQRGRWSRFPAFVPRVEVTERSERWARQLLNRYGVMFRDLLAREDVAPKWGELVRVYRRLESQGKVRGGRFVSGVGGEQYALPDAVDRLRRVRDAQPSGENLILSAADPLNLFGVILPGERIPALASNAVAIRDARLVASFQAGEVRFHASLPLEEQAQLGRKVRISAAARLRRDSALAEEQRYNRWERRVPAAPEEAGSLV